MRKGLWLLSAVVVMALLGFPAYAVVTVDGVGFTAGPNTAKLSDFSSLYDANNTPVGLPATGVFSAPLGDTQVTVFQISDIFPKGKTSLQDTYSPVLPGAPQVTGVLADLKLAKITLIPNGAVLDFQPVLAVRNNPSYGGNLLVYANPAQVFTPDPGGVGSMPLPAASVSPLPAGNAPSFVGAAPGYSFPNDTIGPLLVDAELVDLNLIPGQAAKAALGGNPLVADDVLRETVYEDGTTGSGTAYALAMNGLGDYTATEGDLDPFIDPNGLGLLGIADITLNFDLFLPSFDPLTGNWEDTTNYSGPGDWPVQSEDPIGFSIIVPEPATMALLGFALTGLLIRRRK